MAEPTPIILHDPSLMPRQPMRLWPLVLVAAIGAAAIVWLVDPGAQSPAEHANRQKCAANLRQIHRALEDYAKSHAGRYPDTLGALLEYNLRPADFICPASGDTEAAGPTTAQIEAEVANPTHCSYNYLGKGLTRTTGGERILVYEDFDNHMKEGMNILWGDGTVQWANKVVAKRVLADLAAGKPPVKGKVK